MLYRSYEKEKHNIKKISYIRLFDRVILILVFFMFVILIAAMIFCMFSEVLVSVFGNDGAVGHIGGDEFIVVMLNAGEDEIIARCERVNTELIEKVQILSLPHRITTSYGYAIREKGSTVNLSMIVDQADKQMYDYKDRHR